MSRIQVRRVESPESDPSGFDGLTISFQDFLAEIDPGDPPPSSREARSELFGSSPDRINLCFLATIDDEPVGHGWTTTLSQAGDDLQVAEAELFVRKPFRRRGVAHALAKRVRAELVGLGQTSLIGFCCAEVDPDASAALCAAYGLTRRNEERCSRVRIEDIDDDLLSRWTADAKVKAPGYRLEQWVGVCPPRFEELWVAAAVAMEDEPLDDIDYNPYTRSAEVRRQSDTTKVSHGYRIHRTLCLSPDGEAAGMSAIFVHEDRPQIGHQADTGVVAEHRGHGLGRWMKAANYQQVRRHHPELAVLETYNAESNPWMLAINVAMGYKPHHAYAAFQGPIG